MKPISIGNFEGFESLPGMFGEPVKPDAEGFGEMLDGFAGLVPVVPAALTQQPVPTPDTTPAPGPVVPGTEIPRVGGDPNSFAAPNLPTATDNGGKTRGFNPDIERLMTTINFDKAPTGVSEAPDDPATPATGPIRLMATTRLEVDGEIRRNPTLPTFPSRTGGIKTPPEDTKVVTTPDIIVMPGSEKTKKDPVVVQTPDIIVMPGSEKIKDLPPVGSQSPDIIVMPGSEKTKDLPPVSQDSPDILVLPDRNTPAGSVKQPVQNTPDIIVPPATLGLVRDGGIPEPEINPILGLPEVNNVAQPSRELMNEQPITVVPTDNMSTTQADDTIKMAAEGIDQLFDTTGVTLAPQMRDGRIKGFDLLPADVKALVEKFEPFLRETAGAAQNSAAPAPLPADSATAPGALRPETVTFSNLSRFWVKSDGEKTAGGGNDVRLETKPARISSFANSPQTVSIGVTDAAQIPAPGPTNIVSSVNQNPNSADILAVGQIREDRPDANFIRENADVNQPETAGGVRFEQVLANVSTEPNLQSAPAGDSLRNGLVADQVNPHLLELASLAARKNEKQTMKMRLHPAELGTVEIQLERAENGLLNASFQTETPGARDALSNNLDQLRESLQQAGWQVGSMDVSSDSRGQREPQRDPQQPPSRFDSFVNGVEIRPAASASGETQKNSPNRLLSLIA